jgi:hypothetical protein
VGYTIDIAKAKTDFLLLQDLPGEVRDRFLAFIDQLGIDHGILQKSLLGQAGPSECIKLLKRLAGKSRFSLDERTVATEVPSQDLLAEVVILREKDGPKRTLSVIFRISLGESKAEEFFCSGCGVRIATKAEVTRAHNVIPSSTWKKILAGAVSALVRDKCGSDNNLIASCEVLCDALYGAARDSKPAWATFSANLPRSSRIGEDDWNCLLSLLGAGESVNGPGATSYEGGQCASCENLHSNMSLIQRVAFVADIQGTTHRNAVMVSNTLAGPKKDSLDQLEDDEIFEHTKRVAGLVLEEMSRRVKIAKRCVVGTLILENWPAFCEEIVQLAIIFCSIPRDRGEDLSRYWGLGPLAQRLAK